MNLQVVMLNHKGWGVDQVIYNILVNLKSPVEVNFFLNKVHLVLEEVAR